MTNLLSLSSSLAIPKMWCTLWPIGQGQLSVGAFPQRRGGPHTELQHEDKTPGMNPTHVQGHIPLQAEDKELGLVR